MPGANTKVFVVDASFILSFLLPDEKVEETNKKFADFEKRRISFLSTKLLHFEVLNSLRMAYVRKRISQVKAQKLMEDFLNYNIKVREIDFYKAFKLALDNELTVYDASYLHLAKSLNYPLLSLDEGLEKLAKS